jgi:integrase
MASVRSFAILSIMSMSNGRLRARVAAILLLLYAQPLGRILRLTIDDIDTTGPDVLLKLGDPPTPVPEPVAKLLLALRDQRTNMRTATNRDARWLFPGRRAGQPLTTRTISPLIRDLGVPTVPGRVAALHQLVLQAPAPVIAQALGFHHTTTQRHHAAADGTWNRYSPSRH